MSGRAKTVIAAFVVLAASTVAPPQLAASDAFAP